MVERAGREYRATHNLGVNSTFSGPASSGLSPQIQFYIRYILILAIRLASPESLITSFQKRNIYLTQGNNIIILSQKTQHCAHMCLLISSFLHLF